MEIPQIYKESRYGMPSADLILPNRNYIIGYSYLFRQPKFGLHIIKKEDTDTGVERNDSFREDQRIPDLFRSTLKDYSKSGYDRGHIVPSGDRRSNLGENSETFLMSNMSPQSPELNRKTWVHLEQLTRDLASQDDVLEVYDISGPLFDVTDIKMVGGVMVPRLFFKSLLVEYLSGRIKFFSMLASQDGKMEKCSINHIEKWGGMVLWDKLKNVDTEKGKVW
jgi:endonuclease G, mitochondrial